MGFPYFAIKFVATTMAAPIKTNSIRIPMTCRGVPIIGKEHIQVAGKENADDMVFSWQQQRKNQEENCTAHKLCGDTVDKPWPCFMQEGEDQRVNGHADPSGTRKLKNIADKHSKG